MKNITSFSHNLKLNYCRTTISLMCQYLVKSINHKTPHYTFFFLPFRYKYTPQRPFLKTPLIYNLITSFRLIEQVTNNLKSCVSQPLRPWPGIPIQFATNCQNILHPNECTHTDVCPIFQTYRGGSERLKGHKNVLMKSLYFKLELSALGEFLSAPELEAKVRMSTSRCAVTLKLSAWEHTLIWSLFLVLVQELTPMDCLSILDASFRFYHLYIGPHHNKLIRISTTIINAKYVYTNM